MNVNFGGYSPIRTSMGIWVVAMLVEHDLITRVPRSFPTVDEADFVSYMLRKSNFELMLANNAGCIRRFGSKNLNNVITGQDFFTKMKEFVRKNAYKEGYIPI
ncbi:Glucuronosyltransferase [Caenorhabditis elegans]|uniref:Glucuronosyltransferase n=1 Tax=Caenorhabditis elegans TaxID=6239 RepID=G5ECS5_CAEEL|nr:Glucuronosyltransferase [Caenorhabditis elegans]CAZ65511.1 Glucuronosyltransferase [Caenorhabditis elegans]|eukprot:NP_001257267.1 Uncharacterized protein CELE_K09E9.7 [Caenorhabditis elegans]